MHVQLWLDYHPVTYYTASPTACFDHTNTALRSASTNHPSAIEHPEIITKSIVAETGAQRLVGPLNPTLYPYVQTTIRPNKQPWRYKHSERWRPIAPDIRPIAPQIPQHYLPSADLHKSRLHHPTNHFVRTRYTVS